MNVHVAPCAEFIYTGTQLKFRWIPVFSDTVSTAKILQDSISEIKTANEPTTSSTDLLSTQLKIIYNI